LGTNSQREELELSFLEGKSMALHDPVAVYNAESNVEAYLLCDLLNDAGIEACTTQDVLPVGVSVYGLNYEINKPQVWTERADIERAKPILEEYERQQSQQRRDEAEKSKHGSPTLVATCEECGQSSVFPTAENGTVQECPHCGAYMDVEEIPATDN
jgi:hypothetical protein